jgi:hypothetical protein
MAEELNIRDEIKRARKREPFIPFKLVMTSGDRYEVKDPDSIAIGESIIVILPPRSVSVHLRMNQVITLEEFEAAH